jgi:hypothetical protein
MPIFQAPLRMDNDLATKIRMIAASNNTPMNTYIVKVLSEHADRWEREYGKLPIPPAVPQED